MDIGQFLDGLRVDHHDPSDLDRQQRFHHATRNSIPSPYIDQMMRFSLAGKAFESYYWNRFPLFFDSPTCCFPKQSLYHFAVQQLSVRSRWYPTQNSYFFAGQSRSNFYASIVDAPRFLLATWIGGSQEDQRHLQAELATQDDWRENLTSFEVSTEAAISIVSDLPTDACGLFILDAPLSGESAGELINRVIEKLSPGGTIISHLECSPLPHTIKDFGVVSFSVDLPSVDDVADQRVVILRREQ